MQVLLDIPKSNAPFVLELLDRLSLKATKLPAKKLSPKDKKKAEVLEGLRNAVNEIKAGRKKPKMPENSSNGYSIQQIPSYGNEVKRLVKKYPSLKGDQR
ncbi:MAG: hypothetical protein LBU65_02665 [Planctomycetaceae bacterium]|jgi:hypothetical protein|nr:hypothetical protein [Planctomycetaceae bacterium]